GTAGGLTMIDQTPSRDRTRKKRALPQSLTRDIYHVTANTIVSVESKTLRKDSTQESSYTLYDGFLRPRQTQSPGPDSGYLLTDTFYNDRGQSVLGFAPYYATGTTVTAGKLLTLDDTENVETQTITAYDGLGRPTTVKTAAGSSDQPKLLTTTTTIYGGDRTTVIPPLGATPTTTITDPQGRTSEVRQYHNADATGAYDRTTYKYDPAGHMTTLTGPDNAQWTRTYDLQGRQIQAVDPDKGTSDSHYDNRDQLTWTKDSENRQLYYDYDQLGRKLAVHTGSATGPLTASWKYDPSGYEGQLASSSSYRTVGGTQYEYKTTVNFYDNLYRPTRTTTAIPNVPGEEAFPDSLQVNTTYNPDGTLASTSYPAAGNLPNEGHRPHLRHPAPRHRHHRLPHRRQVQPDGQAPPVHTQHRRPEGPDPKRVRVGHPAPGRHPHRPRERLRSRPRRRLHLRPGRQRPRHVRPVWRRPRHPVLHLRLPPAPDQGLDTVDRHLRRLTQHQPHRRPRPVLDRLRLQH
ncbi:hypothetical protein ACFYWP_42710, partial [Actinacidiphila glaucinigra]